MLAVGVLLPMLAGVATSCDACHRQSPSDLIEVCPGQFKLSEKPSAEVYGFGSDLGVTVQTKDEIHFVFEYAESVPVIYYIRFEPRGVDRKEQVDISLNGVHIAYVEPAQGDYAKFQQVKLPKKYLKAGIENEIVLDHIDNPPNSVPWAIAAARLISRQLVYCPGDECVREAKKQYDLADSILASRSDAADGRLRAWTALHRCLLFLESLESTKPALYTLAQTTLRELDKDLEAKCNQILKTAKRNEALNDPKKALWEYKNGLSWFPESDDEHPCREKLLEKIQQLEGVGDGGVVP